MTLDLETSTQENKDYAIGFLWSNTIYQKQDSDNTGCAWSDVNSNWINMNTQETFGILGNFQLRWHYVYNSIPLKSFQGIKQNLYENLGKEKPKYNKYLELTQM